MASLREGDIQNQRTKDPRYHDFAAIFGSADRLGSPQGSGWLVPLLVGLGTYTVVILRPFNLLNDADTLWHIVVGRWIIEHRALPFHDTFTHTVVHAEQYGYRSTPRLSVSWLTDIDLALEYF